MNKKLILLIGGTGAVGNIILDSLLESPIFEVAVCSRKNPTLNIQWFKWSFGEQLPVEEIANKYPQIRSVYVIYSAIKWPVNVDDFNQNIAALKAILKRRPKSYKFVYISSIIAQSSSDSWYARLKRAEEAIALENNGQVVRIGVIDSAIPLGQVAFFISFARRFVVVPVPFPNAIVTISTEQDIKLTINNILLEKISFAGGIFNVYSSSTRFITYVRQILRQNLCAYFCIPIPKVFSTPICQLIKWALPNSWIAERIEGLRSLNSTQPNFNFPKK